MYLMIIRRNQRATRKRQEKIMTRSQLTKRIERGITNYIDNQLILSLTRKQKGDCHLSSEDRQDNDCYKTMFKIEFKNIKDNLSNGNNNSY